MSKIKPVYQSQTGGVWHDVTDKEYAFRRELSGVYQTRILYPAEAYEALQKENAAQAKRIEELEAATEHLGLTPQQAADGLARYKAQVAEIESLRKQVEDYEFRFGILKQIDGIKKVIGS